MQQPDRVMLRARSPEDGTPTGILIPCSPGWFRAVGEGFEVGIFIGCGEDADGRVVVTALLAWPGTRLSTALLRALPMGRLEAVLQSPDLRAWALSPQRSKTPATLQQHLAGAVTAHDQGPAVSMSGFNVSEPGMWPVGAGPFDWQLAQQPVRQVTPRGPLGRPGSRLTDSFLLDVADRYRELAEQTHKPTLELARAADVPLPTARRWVSAARSRGYLGPGHKGRANP